MKRRGSRERRVVEVAEPGRHFAFDEGKDIAPLVVDADPARGVAEPRGLQVAQQPANELDLAAGCAPDGVADPHDLLHPAPAEPDLIPRQERLPFAAMLADEPRKEKGRPIGQPYALQSEATAAGWP